MIPQYQKIRVGACCFARRDYHVSDETKVTAKIEPFLLSWPEDMTTLSGGNSANPTWAEYLELFEDEFHPVLVAIRKVVEEVGLVGTLASRFCNQNYFQISDGTKVCFTWRGWGDFMQAIVGKREGYMTYYC